MFCLSALESGKIFLRSPPLVCFQGPVRCPQRAALLVTTERELEYQPHCNEATSFPVSLPSAPAGTGPVSQRGIMSFCTAELTCFSPHSNRELNKD